MKLKDSKDEVKGQQPPESTDERNQARTRVVEVGTGWYIDIENSILILKTPY